MSIKVNPQIKRPDGLRRAQSRPIDKALARTPGKVDPPAPRPVDPAVLRNLERTATPPGGTLASSIKRGLAAAVNSAASQASTPPPPDDASAFKRMSKGHRTVALDQARKACNASGDPAHMNQVDLFRDRLSPAARAEYDRQLEALRNDPRVSIHGPNGEPVDLATRELVLRGMLSATFPDKAMLDNAIQTAVDSKYADGKVGPDGQGKFDVIVYPDSFDIADHTYPDAEGQAPGLKTQDGDCVISQSFLDHTIVSGENVMTHEFAHCLQSASATGGVAERRPYPADFPFADEVDKAFDSDPAFQQLLKDQFGVVHKGQERFPTLQVLFRCYPEKLKEASPELYDLMVRYTGNDPLKGTTLPPGKRERLRPEGPSCPAEPPSNDQPWWRDVLDKLWPG